MAKPTVAIRVSPELYQEVFGIAEDRDVSMNEALDMLIYRLRKQGGEQSAKVQGSKRARSVGKQAGSGSKRNKTKRKPAKTGALGIEGLAS